MYICIRKYDLFSSVEMYSFTLILHFLVCILGSVDDTEYLSPPYEERRDETADENVPPLNLQGNERIKTGSDTARSSTLQE